jgi:hypothetical protein
MKAIHLLYLMAIPLLAQHCSATDITTRDGIIYKHAKVTGVEPDGLHITHSFGVAKVPFEKLPRDIQLQYNYDSAKIEAGRKAEEERQAASRADEERAVMERKTGADAVFANHVAEFKKDAADLLANTSLPASDFQKVRTLNDVKELSDATRAKISALDEKVRSFREKGDAERFIEACRAEIATVSALRTRSEAAREIHASNAAAALADLD